ncbi:zinc finger CCHC-type containing 7 [Anticarsia gemmatalis]|uniref:zinc finger CCHC-type containing 7 n=1 Tax=Anticarsia gemmatalis TaxID=129554 RepID=UPI003F766734
MEEELNEHDLEERLYAMLHHVDGTEGNLTSNQNQNDASHIVDNTPKSTVRRYWRTSEPTNPYQKVNTPKEPTHTPTNNKQTDLNQTAKPKEEKSDSTKPTPTVDLSIFQSPVPQNIKKTIEIIEEEDDDHVVLESSDEDEVIEVALPPKPTITIESSDEDELTIINPDSPSKTQANVGSKTVSSGEREVSASPAPSAVSSVSDEFIRGDCIALNISSRHPDNPSFDFSLHGSDLLVQSTPSKKKKKKKSKEAVTSTPVVAVTPDKATTNDECFATPKSKAKNKKQKTKLYAVTEKSIPSADVYDSDSNQSIDINKNTSSYTVTEKSLPSTDVYESDSNLSECAKETPKKSQSKNVDSSDSNTSQDKIDPPSKTTKKNDTTVTNDTVEDISIVDLTDNDQFISIDNVDDSDITENIVMGNVSGFTESDDYDDVNVSESDTSKFGSTKIPSILNEDLDFDNLKGKDKVCKRRRYSLTTLRAEMEKFYNESWGGENFNHREIQKSMSRDKSLWVIDPKDRMPSMAKRRVMCNYCNRSGHRDDTCRLKPPVCYMCGLTGHLEPRCPRKICVNCGSPNQMYSSMCHNCCNWGTITCSECGQNGHPATHCPDLWRRYHNTIDNNTPLERCNQTKKHYQQYCSGCTRRGHLVHSCRVTLPFSGLPINSPYVCFYRPLHPASPTAPNKRNNDSCVSLPNTPRNDRNKRQSKSPLTHETHMSKRRNTMSACEDDRRNTKSPLNAPQRKTSVSKDDDGKKESNKSLNDTDKQGGVEKAPNFIPIFSANHDKKGNMIQDNEVSDTSDVVTSARIYVTNDIIERLKTDAGQEWLKDTTEKCNIEVENTTINSFLNIKGKVGDQESFQAQLRDWVKPSPNDDSVRPSTEGDSQDKSDQQASLLPKNRNNLLRQLSKALESLKEDLGDPSALYKELMYLQKRHQQLLKQKIVNPKQLTSNRGHINQMFKRLNMVLLGQAGLADGSEHLTELYSFQEKLMNSRQKNIPAELRKEIGQHYMSIFTPLPRDDYMDLLKKYHQESLLTKKKKKALKLKPKVNRLQKKVSSIPTQQIQNGNTEKNVVAKKEVSPNINPHLMQKLAFYHKRLQSARPTSAALKKTRLDLVRRLHSSIASMFRKEKISSKAFKKMKRTQEQAQLFLANV